MGFSHDATSKPDVSQSRRLPCELDMDRPGERAAAQPSGPTHAGGDGLQRPMGRGWSHSESQSGLAFRLRPVTVRVQVCTGNEEVGGGSDKQRDEVLQHRHG